MKSPLETAPSSMRRTISKSSPLAITTGVSRLFALFARRSMSNEISKSPSSTRCPSRTRTSNPRPSSATVSMPTWMRIFAPFAAPSVTACLVRAMEITSPAQGARNSPSIGSNRRPSPIIRPEKTGSGASSRDPIHPSPGAFIMHLVKEPLLCLNGIHTDRIF